jgi:hypothetical protein
MSRTTDAPGRACSLGAAWIATDRGKARKDKRMRTDIWFGRQQQRQCVFCHDNIPSVLTKAHHHHKRVRVANQHRPGIDRTYDLCWSCHLGLLHAGIISIKEVQSAAAATAAGTRKVTHDEVYRLIVADLAAGRRKPDWRALHGLTNEELSAKAGRAWQHPSRRRAQRSEPGAQSPLLF